MNTPANRLTLLSAAVLACCFADMTSWLPSSSVHGCLGGVLALAYLVLADLLWTRGLRRAGQGIRRWVFLAAFAAPMVQVGLSLADAPKDFRDGFAAGYDAGAGAARPMPPRQAPPIQSQVAWVALTALLAVLLDRLERRERDAERQKELTREARAQVLAGKLAPHFIFNALNTLHAQIEIDATAAQATTERLADLFRQVLEAADQPTIPLRQEVAFIEAYLGIEKTRLGRRLQATFDLPEELDSVEIPPLSLQVLVENAVKHGVAPREQGGEIRIGAERTGDGLDLWVEDPGTGLSPRKGTGTALDTLRQRLARPEDLTMGLVGGRHRAVFHWRLA